MPHRQFLAETDQDGKSVETVVCKYSSGKTTRRKEKKKIQFEYHENVQIFLSLISENETLSLIHNHWSFKK